ncbi:hypothetical protein J6590_014079 [Homalodisca vitripennis]|nr:hypothetical protein J6590_014079 [Homalodisca vitripennis]
MERAEDRQGSWNAKPVIKLSNEDPLIELWLVTLPGFCAVIGNSLLLLGIPIEAGRSLWGDGREGAVPAMYQQSCFTNKLIVAGIEIAGSLTSHLSDISRNVIRAPAWTYVASVNTTQLCAQLRRCPVTYAHAHVLPHSWCRLTSPNYTAL